MVNNGTTNVNGRISSLLGSITNNAAFNVTTGGELEFTGDVITQNLGTLDIDGLLFASQDATFNYNDGTILGVPQLQMSRLNLADTATSPVTFDLRRLITLTGDVKQGQTLNVIGVNTLGSELRSADGFTNAGTILLDNPTAVSQSLSIRIENNDPLVNAPTGVITFQRTGPTAGRTGRNEISARLDNRGVINFLADGFLFSGSTAGLSFNSNIINVASGRTLQLNYGGAGVGLVNTPPGAIQGGGPVLNGSTGGSGASNFLGTGNVTAHFFNNSELFPGLTVGAPGRLNLIGNFSQPNVGNLNIDLGGLLAATGHDQINVTGTVTLTNGNLAVGYVNGFTSDFGDSFTIINNDGTDAVTGTFNNRPNGSEFTVSGRQLRILYNGGDGNDVVLLDVTPCTLVVINTNDAGTGSLRAAIICANNNPGPDTITFNIPGAGVRTIAPLTALPIITDAVTIDGYSQPGATQNNLANGHNANLLIELSGANTQFDKGFEIEAPDCVVRGLVINRWNEGIHFGPAAATRGRVEGNFIGTNAAGTAALGNSIGVRIHAGADNNVVGGSTPATRNVLSGNNLLGVQIHEAGTSGNRVEGNYIGTDKNGTADLGNSFAGVEIASGATGNIIGGGTIGARNVISGNDLFGVSINDAATSGNMVQGNFIGTDLTGTTALGNGLHGVDIADSPGNVVGGADVNFRNIISGNTDNGVSVSGVPATGNRVEGNFIGTDVNGTTDLGNGFFGVEIGIDASGNFVGGATSAERNVISGNGGQQGGGVRLFDIGGTPGGGNFVRGNFIGTDLNGIADLGNTGTGVLVENTSGNTVSGNVISGNDGMGVLLQSANSSIVQGNVVGLNATGNQPLGNASRGINVIGGNNQIGGAGAGQGNVVASNGENGIVLFDLGGGATTGNTVFGNLIGTNTAGANLGNMVNGVLIDNGARNNQVGGTATGQANTIAFNGGAGIRINDLQNDQPTGNALRRNSIHSNTLLGINLVGGAVEEASGVTRNDAGDADTGPNNLQNFPALTSAESNGANTRVIGTLNSTSSTAFTVEFFASPSADPSGFGEGQTFLGSATVTTNGAGNATIDVSTLPAVAAGQSITATATNPNGDTGEFASAIVATAVCTTVVTNTNDSGFGSLREAIICANNNPGADTITFNIPGAGVRTIAPQSRLPFITDPVTIDGYSQPGATPNTLPAGNNANLLIELNGANAGNGSDGLSLSADDIIIRGLVINRFDGAGINIFNDASNLIEGNFIGTDPTGLNDLGNGGAGINIEGSSFAPLPGGHTIGGTTPAARNVISGNLFGIIARTTTDPQIIQGNYIGTNRNGTGALGNDSEGIAMDGNDHTIGGIAPQPGALPGNVISGNQIGIGLFDSSNTTVQGNIIGLDVNGTTALGNSQIGVNITTFLGSSNNNLIGGSETGARNLISASGFPGITISHGTSTGQTANGNRIEGNFIGTDITGTLDRGNGTTGIGLQDSFDSLIVNNVISGNNGDGILIGNSPGGAGGRNLVRGNFIGTAPDGTTALGNGRAGVFISNSPDNYVGGVVNNAPNVIRFNGTTNLHAGVVVDGNSAVGNRILGNSINNNAGLGIDLGENGPTPDDNLDADTGPNNLQNSLLLFSASPANGRTVVQGFLGSQPNQTYRVEFFVSPAADPTGRGEGQTFLGTQSVTTDNNGQAPVLNTTLPATTPGQFISATVTDANDNTSEFSRSIEVELADFGDAPTSYGTDGQNAPLHPIGGIFAGLTLGTRIDGEANGQPSPSADADDLTGTPDDEDGVIFTPLNPGQTATATVTANAPTGRSLRLDAFFDSNQDGDFNDTGEKIADDQALTAGQAFPVTINVPANATGTLFFRFRLSSEGRHGPTGPASDGEVEDYAVTVAQTNTLDFGDAPDTYSTLLANNGARHTAGTLRLGANVDTEADGRPTVNADGDDLNGTPDDEDGVTFGPLARGRSATVTVNASAAGRLDAFMDFNRDGDFADAGEKIFDNRAVTAGNNTLSFDVPLVGSAGGTRARFRLSSAGGLSFNGAAANGEVEDYFVLLDDGLDFGDAPDTYSTLFASNGARHVVSSNLFLGAAVDSENDGQPNSTATGDDTGGRDDEDGVTIGALTLGATANVTVISSATGVLNAFMDFNRDGDFADAGEKIFNNQPVTTGSNALSFTVPSTAVPGTTFARFRLSTQSNLSFNGSSFNGEVEDYQVTITAVQFDFGDAPATYQTALRDNGPRHRLGSGLTLGPLADAEADGVPSQFADSDDTTDQFDEEGVTIGRLVPGTRHTVTVNASRAGRLDAFFDFNGDGDFTDADEKVFNNVALAAGNNQLQFDVPGSTVTGVTFARFRISSQGGLGIGGEAPDGEVEDHSVDVDAPASPSLSINDVTVTEGNTGTSNAVFTVTLSVTSATIVSVNFATANGTATAPGDYTATTGTLNIPAGQTTSTITVPIIGDTLDEPNENFTITLSNPRNATIADGTGAGTISDNDPAPSLSIADATLNEGNTGASNMTFTVSLSAASGFPITVAFATSNGTSTATEDYTATTGTLTFPPGTTTRTFTVPVIGDVFDEPDENFTVTLSNPTNATLADPTATGTIRDDDPAPTLVVGDASVNENAGTANFTVTLSAPSRQRITVGFTQSNGTAGAPGDFTLTNGTLTFNAGETTKTFAVPIVDDALDEADEAFNVLLQNPTNATLGDATGVGTIRDNDPPPALSIADVTITEGNNDGTATFTVSLNAPSGLPVSVNFATGDGTATSPSDYTATNGTLTFPPGTTTRTFTVPIIGDTLDEPDENFTVTLTNPTNATLADPTATGTIRDDDPAPALSINNVSVTEGNTGTTNATFTITLSTRSGFTVNGSFATANDTATAPGDYTARTGNFSIPAGQLTTTVTVAIVGDTLDENDETFFVNLSQVQNATVADGQGLGTIRDDDGAPSLPTLSINDVTVTEGNTGTVNAVLTVSLSATSALPVTVNFATANNTATAPADYTAANGTLTFAPGTRTQTITVAVIGDLLDEADERFFVNLSNPTNATLADGQGQVTITDDDASRLSINDVNAGEGTNTLTFTVTLTNPNTVPVTVNFSTNDGTATANEDYTPTNGTLTFNPGETTRTITVPIINDTLDEGNETFTVTLTNPTNSTITDGQGTGTINDDDPAPTLSINNVSVVEGNTGTRDAVFTLTLSARSSFAISGSFATANDTATAPADYIARTGNFSILAGQTTTTVTIAVNGDTLDENDETFLVNLSRVTNSTVADGQGLGIIRDDDGLPSLPSLSINNVVVDEANNGFTSAVFTVRLSAVSAQTVTVNFATANGTAIAPADYTLTTGTLTFAPGTTTRTVTVPVAGDLLDELTENFTVRLSNPQGAIINKGTGNGYIRDNDATPVLTVADGRVIEGDTGTRNMTFAARLSAPSGRDVTVNFSTADGSATAGTDYTANTGTLTIRAGQTTGSVVVIVRGDTLIEIDETLALRLRDVRNATLTATRAIGRIINDDFPGVVQFSAATYRVNENVGNATVEVVRTGGSAGTLTVGYTARSGTAISPADFAERAGTLTFAPGVTRRNFTVPIVSDALDEADEFLNLRLNRPTGGATIGAVHPAKLFITDDDAAPALSLTAASVALLEGNRGTRTAVLNLRLSAASGRDVMLRFATARGTATDNVNDPRGADYQPRSGTLTIPAGQTVRSIGVRINSDFGVEPDETFFVNFSAPVNATLATSRATVTIRNDDVFVDLGISQTDSPDPAIVGQLVTFRVVITNHGPAPASNVRMTNTLPENAEFVSANPTPASRQGRTLNFNLGAMAVREQRVFNIVVRALAAQPMTNAVRVLGDEDDPNGADNQTNNTAVAITQVLGLADVTPQVAVTAGPLRPLGPYIPGLFDVPNRIQQTITLRNTGGVAIPGPVSLALSGLRHGVVLDNRNGVTTHFPPTGLPFINVNVGADNVLTPGESVTVTLHYSARGNAPVTFTPRVLAGPGAR